MEHVAASLSRSGIRSETRQLYSSLGNAIKQARELGITATIMGDYESEDPTVIAFANAAAEGMIISFSQLKLRSSQVSDKEQAPEKKCRHPLERVAGIGSFDDGCLMAASCRAAPLLQIPMSAISRSTCFPA